MNIPDERLDAEDAAAAQENPRADRSRAVLGVIAVAVVIAAAGLAIYHQRRSFASALHHVGISSMLASLLVAALSTALTFLVWRGVLHGLGVDMPWGLGVRVFFTSQLGKYLPGSVWPVLIQMEAGRARGASRRTMLAANLVTIVLSCAVGFTVASALLPLTDSRALSRYWWLLVALPFLLALLHPRAVPMVLDRVFALLRREPLGQRLPVRDSVMASAWSVASFVAQGLHIAILVLAIHGGGFSTVLLCIGGMALAVSAGVLFIPAPAGAGIRDVLLSLVLSGVLTSGEALAVVVASRVILIVADLTLAAAAVTAERVVRRDGQREAAAA
ncbi:MAG: lysylphosphatidylglycerol synthase domain-containing protein [Actinomycetota bacterium]